MPPEDSSTSSPQEPVSDAPSPAVEVPAPATEPAAPPQETPPASAPEATSSESAVEVPPPVEVQTNQPATPTGQIGGNDPLPPEPDPIPSAQPAPEPPSSAAPAQTGIIRTARDLLVKARVTMQDRKRKKREKILQALNTKNKITNDEVEKLLHVSDATAERYLSALVKEGKIKQDRKTGAGVAYQKI